MIFHVRVHPDLVVTRMRYRLRSISLSMVERSAGRALGAAHERIRLMPRLSSIHVQPVFHGVRDTMAVEISSRVLERGAAIILDDPLEHVLRVLLHGQQRRLELNLLQHWLHE